MFSDVVFGIVLVFDSIEEFAPGFKSSVVGRDILTPPDLERIFGLTGGVSQHYLCYSLNYGVIGKLLPRISIPRISLTNVIGKLLPRISIPRIFSVGFFV